MFCFRQSKLPTTTRSWEAGHWGRPRSELTLDSHSGVCDGVAMEGVVRCDNFISEHVCDKMSRDGSFYSMGANHPCWFPPLPRIGSSSIVPHAVARFPLSDVESKISVEVSCVCSPTDHSFCPLRPSTLWQSKQ